MVSVLLKIVGKFILADQKYLDTLKPFNKFVRLDKNLIFDFTDPKKLLHMTYPLYSIYTRIFIEAKILNLSIFIHVYDHFHD